MGFEPRYDFPFNQGKLCPKGVKRYLQDNHPDRLLDPLVRTDDGFEAASWDEAFGRTVGELQRIQAARGRGLAARFRLTTLLERYPDRAVMGSFAFLNGLLTIGLLAGLAMATDTPSLFPSLGPTAFLLFSTPMLPAACPRNTVEGHLIGVLAGYLSLVLFGLTDEPATILSGVSGGRVGAAALSLALTSGFMVWLQRPHPPAGATTLIVSLGLLREPWQLCVLMIAVLLMVVQGYVINRLAGLDYPRWAPAPAGTVPGARAP